MKVIYEPPLRTILIAGAAGFSGQALCQSLARDGAFRVIGVGDWGEMPLPRETGNFAAVGGLADEEVLAALMVAEQVDTIVAVQPATDALLAAVVRYRQSLRPDQHDVLTLAVAGLGPTDETAISTTHGALYGPDAPQGDLIPRTIAAALAGAPIWVDRPGLVVCDWLHIDDYCDAMTAVLLRGQARAHYHLSAREGRSVLATVAMICDLVDRVAPRADGRKHRSLIRFGQRVADYHGGPAATPTRLEQELGWRARVSLRDGLIALIDDQRRAATGPQSVRAPRA